MTPRTWSRRCSRRFRTSAAFGATSRGAAASVDGQGPDEQDRRPAPRPSPAPEAIPSEHLDAVPEARQLDLDFAPGEDADHTLYGPILDRVKRRCTEPNNWRPSMVSCSMASPPRRWPPSWGCMAQVHTARSRVLRRLREEIGAEAAPLSGEFEDPTWSLFLEVAVEGRPPEVVARQFDMEESGVDRGVAGAPSLERIAPAAIAIGGSRGGEVA